MSKYQDLRDELINLIKSNGDIDDIHDAIDNLIEYQEEQAYDAGYSDAKAEIGLGIPD